MKVDAAERPLATIPTGTRVRKPSAGRFDFAYGRAGTVVREEVEGDALQGVRWDGSSLVYAYPGETPLVLATAE